MEITMKAYGEAVQLLLNAANTGTSGGRASAQVLLCAYNGEEWQLDVTDLGILDHRHYDAAITVIRGRKELWHEPQEVVENGGRRFDEILKRWGHLRVSERGKRTCFNCYGSGKVPVALNKDNCDEMVTCQRCDGKGRYWQE